MRTNSKARPNHLKFSTTSRRKINKCFHGSMNFKQRSSSSSMFARKLQFPVDWPSTYKRCVAWRGAGRYCLGSFFFFSYFKLSQISMQRHATRIKSRVLLSSFGLLFVEICWWRHAKNGANISSHGAMPLS